MVYWAKFKNFVLKIFKKKKSEKNQIYNTKLKKNLTKAETLSLIKKQKKNELHNLIIPEFLFFSKSDFLNNKKKIILKIKNKFKKKKNYCFFFIFIRR